MGVVITCHARDRCRAENCKTVIFTDCAKALTLRQRLPRGVIYHAKTTLYFMRGKRVGGTRRRQSRFSCNVSWEAERSRRQGELESLVCARSCLKALSQGSGKTDEKPCCGLPYFDRFDVCMHDTFMRSPSRSPPWANGHLKCESKKFSSGIRP